MTKIITLKLAMSNAFVLCDTRPILIDCGGPRDLPALTRQLHRHDIHIADLALLLLTHVHFDHAGSAAAIQRAGCPLAVHRLEGEYLARGHSAPIIPVHALGRLLMPFMGAEFAPATADMLIEERLDFVRSLGADGIANAVDCRDPQPAKSYLRLCRRKSARPGLGQRTGRGREDQGVD